MFRFDRDYPISAPAVQFVVDEAAGKVAPEHPVRSPSNYRDNIPHMYFLYSVYSTFTPTGTYVAEALSTSVLI
jgi:hypothetical protein